MEELKSALSQLLVQALHGAIKDMQLVGWDYERSIHDLVLPPLNWKLSTSSKMRKKWGDLSTAFVLRLYGMYRPKSYTPDSGDSDIAESKDLDKDSADRAESKCLDSTTGICASTISWAIAIISYARTLPQWLDYSSILTIEVNNDGYINLRFVNSFVRKLVLPSTPIQRNDAKITSPKKLPLLRAKAPDTFNLESIGTFHSCFKEKFGTPRQGTVSLTTRGQLRLHDHISTASIEGLSEYSHVWLIFVFHANTDNGFKPKIKPPRLLGKKIGTFATRTPHRINPIGLTVAKIESISTDGLIYFSGIDLIEGTPILDIKPYHPADCLISNLSTLSSERKYVEDLPRFPSWMSEIANYPLTVAFTDKAIDQLTSAVPDLEMYSTFDEMKQVICDTIQLDPRTIHSKRKHPNGIFGISIDRIDITFHIRPCEQNTEGKQPSDQDKFMSSQALVYHIALRNTQHVEVRTIVSASSSGAMAHPRHRHLRTSAWFEAMQKELKEQLGKTKTSSDCEV